MEKIRLFFSIGFYLFLQLDVQKQRITGKETSSSMKMELHAT